MCDEGSSDTPAPLVAEPPAAEDAKPSPFDDENFKLETVPFDPRFPNQNQAKHCYSSFIDYHRCIKARGDDYPPCQYYAKAFKSLCPNFWVEKWQTQLDEGRFAGPIDK